MSKQTAVPAKVLEQQLAAVQREIAQADEDIARMAARKTALEYNLAFIKTILSKAVEISPNGTTRRKKAKKPKGLGRLGLTDAVLKAVHAEPGLIPGEIVNRARELDIQTNAKDVPRNLFQTITNLLNRGRLTVKRDRIYPVVDGEKVTSASLTRVIRS